MRTLLVLCLLLAVSAAATRRPATRRPVPRPRVTQPAARQDAAPALLGGSDDTNSRRAAAPAAAARPSRTRTIVVTAYTSAARETDATPFLAAWNNRLACDGATCGMRINGSIQRIIAISRSLERAGLRNGMMVTFSGLGGDLDGVWRVGDKMSSRFTYDKADLYFGVDLRGARKFGVRRNVRISW